MAKARPTTAVIVREHDGADRLFWTGRSWNPEFPEALIFTALPPALHEARVVRTNLQKHPGGEGATVSVVERYGEVFETWTELV